MGTPSLFAFELPPWLLSGAGISVAVGLGTALLVSLFFVCLARRKPALAAPPQTDASFDPFAQGSASEQRKAFRRGGNPIEVSIRHANDERSECRGQVLDRSVGGLCLRCEQEWSVGSVLHVRPTGAPPLMPWVEIEVKSIQPEHNAWRVGCQFLHTPTWAMLLMFG